MTNLTNFSKLPDQCGMWQKIFRKFTLTALCLLFLANAYCQQIDIPGYIADHKMLATILSETYGIPYPVIMAVAIVESSAGTCEIDRVLNNHFGMAGKNTYINRFGHKSRYKQYDNEIESYIDFCMYISSRRYYPKLHHKKDPRLWVQAISTHGYSEEPEMWAEKILHTIHTQHLN